MQSCNFPNILIDTLYRQNIKNYNPYIETLDQLEEEAVSLPLRERIEHLCYLGIAKAYLKTKKYAIGPTYSRVNVLIRTYMREMMCE